MTSPFPHGFSPDSLEMNRFHFVGIGGCGMSGLARLLANLGGDVQGTDVVESAVTQKLDEDGITVSYLQDGTTISQDIDIIIHSAAIPPDHPEINRADELGIPDSHVCTNARLRSIGTHKCLHCRNSWKINYSIPT